MSSSNGANAPEPIDVSPEDLRAGKFQLNPHAEAERRAQRSTWHYWLTWIAFYVSGFVAGKVLKLAFGLAYRTTWGTFWAGFGAIVALYVIARFAYERLSGGRPFPEAAVAACITVLVGMWNGLY